MFTILKFANLIIGSLIFLLTWSCRLGDYPSKKTTTSTTTPIETQNFVQNGHNWVFKTNDSQYIKSSGYTFFKWLGRDQNPFVSYEVKLRKLNGNTQGSFGIVFCYQSQENKFIVLNIDTYQNYYLGLIKNGHETAVNTPAWKYVSALSSGLGAENTIKVQYNNVTGIFSWYANGTKVIDFQGEAGWNSGDVGFNVIIQNTENFPDVPVNVLFEILNPRSQASVFDSFISNESFEHRVDSLDFALGGVR